MLSKQKFIRQSVNLNLFFLRIIKEHLIFAATAFTLRDTRLIQDSINLKARFEQLLKELMPLAAGQVSPEVISAGEHVTPFTLRAEAVTQSHTGISIDMGLTQMEMALGQVKNEANVLALEHAIAALNQRAIALTQLAIRIKTMVYNHVASCKMFTNIYPTMLMHVIHEAEFYLRMLTMLQNREDMTDTVQKRINQEVFWNHIMGQHGEFIRGMLDPFENALMETAGSFTQEFGELFRQAIQARQQAALLPQVTRESLEATRKIRAFKAQGTQGILECRIKSVILPLLADHVLREASHYLRLLRMFQRM